MNRTIKLRNFWFLAVLFMLVNCAKTMEINLPGFSYLDKKISLNVAAIDIIDETTTDPKTVSYQMVPSSMAPILKEWAEKRFTASGSRGKATIRFKEAQTIEEGLLDEKDIHVLLNSSAPAHFGANVHVVLEVQDTPTYSTGKTEATLLRKVEVASDIKLAFRGRLWQQFSQNFMNAFDEQMVLNIQTYLPQLLNLGEVSSL
ncbi:MAG: hypothetical protein FJX18_04145 [Alphaproteobacteria bacterium]|nr:hypothetical protein [Alphaproteobacteria bacterium]